MTRTTTRLAGLLALVVLASVVARADARDPNRVEGTVSATSANSVTYAPQGGA